MQVSFTPSSFYGRLIFRATDHDVTAVVVLILEHYLSSYLSSSFLKVFKINKTNNYVLRINSVIVN